MIDSASKNIAAERMIEAFAAEFFNKFGVNPIIVYDTSMGHLKFLTLQMLEDVINASLKKRYGEREGENITISSRSRKREVILHRQLFAYIARALKYHFAVIGKKIGFDHASMIHARKAMEFLLSISDTLAKEIYAEVYKELETLTPSASAELAKRLNSTP